MIAYPVVAVPGGGREHALGGPALLPTPALALAGRAGLAGDVPILIRRGDESFWSGPIRDYDHRVGDRVPALDPRDKVSAWADVIGRTRHPDASPWLRLVTESGRRLVVHAGAGLATLGPDGELHPLATREVVAGRTRLPIVRPGLLDVPNAPLGRDQGRLAGLYLSEGHCPPGQPGLVCIAVADHDRACQVFDLLARLGQRPYHNAGKVSFTGRATCRWLVDHFGHLAHHKRVPAWALAQGRPFAEGLVEGYMGGDGCLWADGNGAVQVTAVSVSPTLRDGLVDLLAALDVFCTFFDAPRSHLKPQWRDGFGMRVISRDLHKLNRWFFYDDREEKLARLRRATYRASIFDQVPVSRQACKALYAGFLGRPPVYIYQTANRGAVSKDRIRDCLGPYGAWGRSDVAWDRVMAVEPAPTEGDGYGLAVAAPWLHGAGHGLLVRGDRPGDIVVPGEPT